jgi:hypothetical protein
MVSGHDRRARADGIMAAWQDQSRMRSAGRSLPGIGWRLRPGGGSSSAIGRQPTVPTTPSAHTYHPVRAPHRRPRLRPGCRPSTIRRQCTRCSRRGLITQRDADRPTSVSRIFAAINCDGCVAGHAQITPGLRAACRQPIVAPDTTGRPCAPAGCWWYAVLRRGGTAWRPRRASRSPTFPACEA